jgi:hypothetical protein
MGELAYEGTRLWGNSFMRELAYEGTQFDIFFSMFLLDFQPL